jgi:UDP-N-acetylmuramate dehydrogenase
VEYQADGGDTLVRAGAGEPWDDLVSSAVSRGLAGIECLSGIPGSVGGTPIQNVGAYGQEVADTIQAVLVFDRQSRQPQIFSAADCRFAYRTSRFKQSDAGRFIVCEVTFRLRLGPATVTYADVVTHLERHRDLTPDVAGVRQAVLAIRRGKGMVLDDRDPDTCSVGSFFMNPVVSADLHAGIAVEYRGPGRVPGFAQPGGGVKMPAAWLIEQSGLLRGHRSGRAAISSKHPLALVNLGGATAREVVVLARHVKERVAARFGISLRPEPVFVGFDDDDEDVAYLLRT